MMFFETLEYLKSGNQRQKDAYQIITENAIFEKLNDFSPLLAGTIPIEIDIPASDLDIICCYTDQSQFTQHLVSQFQTKSSFSIREHDNKVICNFDLPPFEVEIFGQNIPSKEQNGFQHMLIEYQILQREGEDFRQRIIELKRKGYKTEPAFALLLNIKGDPYTELLKYKF